LFDLHDGALLTVHNRSDARMPWFGRFIGHLHPQLSWRTELIHRAESAVADESAARQLLETT